MISTYGLIFSRSDKSWDILEPDRIGKNPMSLDFNTATKEFISSTKFLSYTVIN